jgi:DNA-binding XRE family transcriptional regulator
MNFLKYCVIIFVFCLYSCDSGTNNQKNDQGNFNSLRLSSTNEFITLPLDSLTGFKHLSFSINSNGAEDDWISFINSQTNSLYIYSLKDREIIRVNKFAKEGPEGIGSMMATSHLLHNLDSIFIYNPNLGTLFLFDGDTHLINKFKVVDFKKPDLKIIPEPIGLAKFQIIGKEIFFPSTLAQRLNDYSNISSQTIVNIETGAVRYDFVFPKVYSNAYWGSAFKYCSTLTFDGQNILVNFPIDEEIHIQNIENQTNSKAKIPSNQISTFKPMDEDIKFGTKPRDDSFYSIQDVYSFSNSDFAGLLYDQFRNVYYRIVYARPTLDEVKNGDWIPDISIITFDRQFQILSEILLEKEKYDPSMMGISRNGLLIARKDLFSNDENNLSLEIFRLQ